MFQLDLRRAMFCVSMARWNCSEMRVWDGEEAEVEVGSVVAVIFSDGSTVALVVGAAGGLFRWKNEANPDELEVVVESRRDVGRDVVILVLVVLFVVICRKGPSSDARLME